MKQCRCPDLAVCPIIPDFTLTDRQTGKQTCPNRQTDNKKNKGRFLPSLKNFAVIHQYSN